MSAAAFQLGQQPGIIAARGQLTFETAAAALESMTAALANGEVAQLDLAGIEHSDSAGLACVLAVQARAARLGHPLTVCNMPSNMHALARVCEVDALGG